MRRRTRLCLTAITCLLLGMATSVLVAWGIALGADEGFKGSSSPFSLISPNSRAYTSSPDAPVEFARAVVGERSALGRRARWIGNADTIPKKTPFVQGQSILDEWHADVALRKLPFPDRLLSWGELDRPFDKLRARRQYAFGFPCPALWYERSGGLGMFGSAMQLHGGHEVAKTLGRKRTGLESHAALPFRPIWLGMALNTLFYACVWLVPLFAVQRLRQRRVRRAGLCPSCRYNLKGIPSDAPCPECGSPRVLA